ncbi:MAG: hypothetical protein RLZZ415_17, partial [Pseudomonadota bacterium]
MRLPILLASLILAAPLAAQALPATVAVEFDRHSIRPVLAEGLADRTNGRAVTADSPVRIASISKLVTTLAVLRLVDQGKLSLDRDVSDYLGWPLRNPAYPDQPITLRLLLSHQSSLRDGGERYIIPLDVTLRERLAEPAMWDAQHGPKAGWFAYSNINFPIAASVIERVTGERFDVAISRLVLRPLKLDACYNWGAGCSATAFRNAAILYRSNGDVARDDLKGQPPLCPVVAAQDGSCDLTR